MNSGLEEENKGTGRHKGLGIASKPPRIGKCKGERGENKQTARKVERVLAAGTQKFPLMHYSVHAYSPGCPHSSKAKTVCGKGVPDDH